MRALAPQWRNRLQSALLLAAMAAIWALLGWSLGGPGLTLIALGAGLIALLAGLPISAQLVLLVYRTRPLPAQAAPELHDLLAELSRRAGLPRVPGLHLVPSSGLNAFTVGSRHEPVVAVSDGLLRTLPWRELAAVLAHEVSHLRHNDQWVMALADLVNRMTHLLSLTGQVLLLVNLPLILLTDLQIPWLTVLLLILAPTLTALLQLALSRQREYDADLGAVRLTGDPQGLALALVHLERLQGSWLAQLLVPGGRVPEPWLLRTHPPTAERVRRLEDLAAGQRSPLQSVAFPETQTPPLAGRPRRRSWRDPF